MEQTRILLADDHKIVLEGLKGLLEGEFNVVGTVEDGRELLTKAKELCPDVIVADITMPSLNGIDAVQQLREKGSQAKVVFLTMHHDASYAKKAFDVGASGYVLKHSAPDELVTAIREVIRGRTYVTPMIAEELMQSYKDGGHSEKGDNVKLTSRHKEILQLLAEGKSAKEIASVLHLSSRTVEFHKYHMMEMLAINNTAELIQYAIKQGIVTI
jgi:DNA-binding NarL/FixJ family response regulator